MGTVATVTENDRAIRRFACRLHEELGIERVLLFGAHAMGCVSLDYEYNLILVGEHFRDIGMESRPVGLHKLFYDVGGDAPLDLICLTPEEFKQAKSRASIVSAVLPEAIDLLAEESVSK